MSNRVHWYTRRDPQTGDWLILAAADASKYAGFEEAQLRIAQQLTDNLASKHAEELEQLYATVQATQDELQLYQGQFRSANQRQWEKFLQTHVVLRLVPDSDLTSTAGERFRLIKQQTDPTNNKALRWNVLTSTNQAAIPSANTYFDANVPPPTAAMLMRGATYTLVATSANMFVGTGSTGSAPVDPVAAVLADLLDNAATNDVAQRALLARRMVEKAQVTVKVHNTAHGARKRRRLEDVDPFGGSAKQWEIDSATRSLDDHLKELRQVVYSVAAGMCSEPHKSPGAVIVVDLAGNARVLRAKNDIGNEYEHTVDKLTYKLDLDLDGETWRYTENGNTYNGQCKLSTWHPSKADYLQGMRFVSPDSGQSVVVFRPPPRLVWCQRPIGTWTCYRFSQLSDKAGVGQWLGPTGSGTLTTTWPAVLASNVDMPYAALRWVSTDGSAQQTIARENLGFGEAIASRTLSDLQDHRLSMQRAGETRMLSASPFQDVSPGMDPDFLARVWQGFCNQINTQSATALVLSPDPTAHFLSTSCYVLQQATTQATSSTAVVQLSNGASSWAVGGTPTVAGDAAAASLTLLTSLVMQPSVW